MKTADWNYRPDPEILKYVLKKAEYKNQLPDGVTAEDVLEREIEPADGQRETPESDS